MRGGPGQQQSVEDARRALARELAALAKFANALAARVTLPEQRLQRDALSGSLGTDLQRLARLVEAGQTTWTSVFDQTSPYAGLAREHLEKMLVAHSGVVRDALRGDPRLDPAFDPTGDGED